jgi:hypothetical protein
MKIPKNTHAKLAKSGYKGEGLAKKAKSCENKCTMRLD